MAPNNIIIILIILILSGCKSSVKKLDKEIILEVKKLEIDVDKSVCLKFSEVFTNPVFIPLETTSDNLFSLPLQTIITDSNIFIVPKDPSFMILIFNKDGKFLNKIYNVGRGPNEYLGFYYIDVDEKKRTITLFDLGSKSFITMDYKGTFLRKVPVKQFYTYKFINHPESGKIVADISNSGFLTQTQNKNKYHILLYDPKTEVIETLLPIYLTQSLLTENSLYNYNGKVYYKPPVMDTIFQVLKSGVSPRYILDFKKHSKPTEMTLAQDKIRFKELRREGDIWLHFDFKETNDFIYSAHEAFGLKWYFHLFNKKDNKSTVYCKVVNDYLGQREERNIRFRDFPIALDRENIVYLHEPTQILRDYDEMKKSCSKDQLAKYLKDNPDFANLISKIKETENPILGFYKMHK